MAPDAISDDPIQTWRSLPVDAGGAAAPPDPIQCWPRTAGTVDPILSWSPLPCGAAVSVVAEAAAGDRLPPEPSVVDVLAPAA
eukprot:6286029-Amphidinium_carterae.1